MAGQIPQLPSLIHTSTVVVSTVFPVLSGLAICLRWYARRQARQALHADDWWILVSWITTLALSIHLWVFASLTGIDKMKGDPIKGISNSLMCLWLASSLVQLPLGAVKISILLFYKRIFSVGKFGIAVWIAIAAIGAWTWLFFFLVLFQLDPVSGAWTGVGRLRFDSAALGLGQVGTSIALDVIVLCFPLPAIRRLQLKNSKKWAVGLIFWLGSFCVVAAIIRLVLLKQSINTVLDATGFNTIFVQWKNFIFMILEPNCSIIAACLPCYGPLFKGTFSLESLVRSVRSVFSLQSLRSQGSGGRAPGSDYLKFGETSAPARSGEVSETNSQIELAHGQKGRAFANVERVSHGDDDIERGMAGINVTKGVEVIRN